MPESLGNTFAINNSVREGIFRFFFTDLKKPRLINTTNISFSPILRCWDKQKPQQTMECISMQSAIIFNYNCHHLSSYFKMCSVSTYNPIVQNTHSMQDTPSHQQRAEDYTL